MQGLIGRKVGMTQVFDSEGRRVAVTVVEAGPCVVVQRKTQDKDGYDAVQLGFFEMAERKATKPALGRFKKIDKPPMRHLTEFRIDASDEIKEGDTLTAGLFDGVAYVDVTGMTKGRGFQGVVKRHGMAGGRMSHGGHSKRRGGAVGQCAYPARIAKGQRMPGHMGMVQVTQQNLRLVAIREDEGLLLVQGAIPGPTGGVIVVRKALKKKGEAKAST